LHGLESSLPPLLTRTTCDELRRARIARTKQVESSFDLGRSRTLVDIAEDAWWYEGRAYPYLDDSRDRTVYHWDDAGWHPVARYGSALVKLVPSEWGAPTFEIDGIKMLPTTQVSPYEDARRKVALVAPARKCVLDTCGGLGYFAAWCLAQHAASVLSFEKNPDVLWLRTINPWSPAADPRLDLVHADVTDRIASLPDASFDAVMHDPPRFGTAGDLYSGEFYAQLQRVLRRRGRLFHYTGTPNRLTSGRDVPAEIARRLAANGFDVRIVGDGILATRC
jgi:predicted methyltransferase